MPRIGFSCAWSGRITPPFVTFSSSRRSTVPRSPSGSSVAVLKVFSPPRVADARESSDRTGWKRDAGEGPRGHRSAARLPRLVRRLAALAARLRRGGLPPRRDGPAADAGAPSGPRRSVRRDVAGEPTGDRGAGHGGGPLRPRA